MRPSENKPLIGESPLMLDLSDQVSRLAKLNKPVLILGERGTGKELVAARLHYLSGRWDQTYLKINCAAMNENLLESELFGHEVGAFTGATKRHIGRFERAEAGSLFMDELANCSMTVQEKLLRVVEYGEYERLGGQTTQQADVRLIAATHADLPQRVEAGEFRADLLDRLAFDVIHIPPLRERDGDLLILAEHFALSICLELGRHYFPGFSPLAIEQLRDHHWPGNVRELRNVIERSVYRQEDADSAIENLVIDPFTPPWQISTAPQATPTTPKAAEPVAQSEATVTQVSDTAGFSEQIAKLERSLILQALVDNQFQQRQAADALGLSYHQLRAQMRKHQMTPLKQYVEAHQNELSASLRHTLAQRLQDQA